MAINGANASLDLSGIMASRLSGLDAASTAGGLLARVQNGESLGQTPNEIKGQLSPVDQGNALRELDQSSAGLLAQNRFPLTGNIDLGKGLSDLVNGAVDIGKQSAG